MNFLTAAHTDVGIKKKVNQDSFCLKVASYKSEHVAFSVLCDGMGGLRMGELASSFLVNAFSEWFDEVLPGELKKGLQPQNIQKQWDAIIRRQNVLIKDYGARQGVSLGTTLTMILIFGNKYIAAHVGDSRLYQISSELRQLTKDHSVVQQMVDAGKITSKEAKVHPQKNLITRALGVESDLEVDFIKTERFEEGSTLVMCSDGLSNYFDDEELLAIINTTSIDMLADTFVANALARGGDDNITVVVISNRENEAPDPLEDVQPAEESQQPDEADTPADSE